MFQYIKMSALALVAMTFSAGFAQAMEATAGGGLTQSRVDISVLDNKFDDLKTLTQSLLDRMKAYETCQQQEMFYDPSNANADADGCVALTVKKTFNYNGSTPQQCIGSEAKISAGCSVKTSVKTLFGADARDEDFVAIKLDFTLRRKDNKKTNSLSAFSCTATNDGNFQPASMYRWSDTFVDQTKITSSTSWNKADRIYNMATHSDYAGATAYTFPFASCRYTPSTGEIIIGGVVPGSGDSGDYVYIKVYEISAVGVQQKIGVAGN